MTVLLTVAFSGCNKEEELLITYPSSGENGENTLTLSEGTVLTMGNSYSLAAYLGKKAELKIIITNVSSSVSGSESIWAYSIGKSNWNVSDYSGIQELKTDEEGRSDLSLSFIGTSGSCQVDFYENSENITKTKNFTW